MRRRALACLAPPPRLPLSQWIEASVCLPEGLCAVPGRMKLYSYQREIADAIGDPDIERVTLLKAARIGFSVLVAAAIGHYCANDPSPTLVLLPTESDARDFMTSDVEPLFASSPALAGILRGESIGQRGRRGRNTMLSRQFAGGSLKIVASHAPRNLRRHTARILFIDEADAMEAGVEGSPIDLATKRTLTFPDRKIVLGSTPIDEDTSHVCRAYESSDQRVFELPCPACGSFHELAWADIVWPPGEPAKAAYACPHCAAIIGEDAKPSMVSAGRWRATAPEIKGHAGFRLNALASTLKNAAWGILAAEFLAAKDDPASLKPFVNTVLAQPWRCQGDELDESGLASRVEPFSLESIPPEILIITAGVDVQADRLEISFVGWTRTPGACAVLAHVVLHGPTDAESIWRDLDDHLKQRWRHPFGGMIGVDAAAIDAGSGGHFDRVMKFAAARAARRVFAIKGAPGFGRPAFKASQSLKSRGSERLYIVGVDSLKLLLFERLKRSSQIRFSDTLDASYFEQLASERLVTKFSRGRPERRFELAPGKRNECLDALIYATAAREGCAIALDAREEALRLHPTASPRPRSTPSKWLTQGY
jgi:phage terminase large subunit GpA-like protein